MSYQIDGNIVIRDGEKVAVVQPDGLLEVLEGMEKYRTQCVKELAKAGRRREDGTFVFVDDVVAATGEIGDAPVKKQTAIYTFPVISTVRELVARIEAATGDAAPSFSKIYGDETPEVWAYLRRHVDAYNALRHSFNIRIKHNHLEE